MDNWIDIEDELPEKAKKVLVKFRDGSEDEAFRCGCCGVGFVSYNTGEAYVHQPIAWRLIETNY